MPDYVKIIRDFGRELNAVRRMLARGAKGAVPPILALNYARANLPVLHQMLGLALDATETPAAPAVEGNGTPDSVPTPATEPTATPRSSRPRRSADQTA